MNFRSWSACEILIDKSGDLAIVSCFTNIVVKVKCGPSNRLEYVVCGNKSSQGCSFVVYMLLCFVLLCSFWMKSCHHGCIVA